MVPSTGETTISYEVSIGLASFFNCLIKKELYVGYLLTSETSASSIAGLYSLINDLIKRLLIILFLELAKIPISFVRIR